MSSEKFLYVSKYSVRFCFASEFKNMLFHTGKVLFKINKVFVFETWIIECTVRDQYAVGILF